MKRLGGAPYRQPYFLRRAISIAIPPIASMVKTSGSGTLPGTTDANAGAAIKKSTAKEISLRMIVTKMIRV